jgi:RimJ/RimL family protein N-acetyltransferase
MSINLREFDEIFLRRSWEWLHDPETKFLTNSPDFTKEQQLEWFLSLPVQKEYLIWGIETDTIPIGACGLKNISETDCEYWGYIGDKKYWGRGLGKEIVLLLETKARDMGKLSLWLRVIKENPRAISLYRKQGFIVESETYNLYVMRKQL